MNHEIDTQLWQNIVFGSNVHEIAQQAWITLHSKWHQPTVVPDNPVHYIIWHWPGGWSWNYHCRWCHKRPLCWSGGNITSAGDFQANYQINQGPQGPKMSGDWVEWRSQLSLTQVAVYGTSTMLYILGSDSTACACKFVKLITRNKYLPLHPLGTLMVSNLPITSTLSESLLICLYDLHIWFVPFINEHGVSVCGNFIILILTLICLPSMLGWKSLHTPASTSWMCLSIPSSCKEWFSPSMKI